jgi:arginine decarboxylase
MRAWTVRDSADLYGISNWGRPYFAVSERGTIVVRPRGEAGPAIDLFDLVEEVRGRGLGPPLLMRFSDILASRVHTIAGCFENAIKEYDYKGAYRGVYPIKVNQQRQVVEELIEFGRPSNLGLEVGSKPELLVALALLDTPGALIICNGYKDRAYMETALLAQRLGRNPIIVVDRPHELEVLVKSARDLGIRPHIGIRARLSTRGAGKWVESTGDRSKFGLTAAEIVQAVERLRAEDMLDAIEMLHFHIGSQITDIRAHKDALREACQIFAGLRELGGAMRYIDVGGGLGVDYDGSQTNFHSSMNYTTQEYAHDVVAAIVDACSEHDIPHPDIVTESGRALVAHSSVLVFDVLGTNEVASVKSPTPPQEHDPRVLHTLWEVMSGVSAKNALESYHDALQAKEEATSAFNLGYLDLVGRARAEELFWLCAQKIMRHVREMEYVPEDLQGLERALADTYYGNFSVFQSMPDSWTVKQLFPLMPIHRLDERPTRRGIFADLTCDSDGKVDQFIDLRDVRRVLELHPPNGKPYYVGCFLVGAYQETLGEAHNLFGDTDTVHIQIDEEGRYSIEQVVEGETVEEVLAYVQYDRRALLERVRRAIEASLRAGTISLEESALLRRRYSQALSGYTYLDAED